MNDIDLCHFGDRCAPGIIINDILKYGIKGLFMLGKYSFNDILMYLNDCNYENIYNKNELIILPDNEVKHSKYNFVFNHDYIIDKSNLTNYNIVRDRFDLKIKNFRNMLSSDNMCVFITFSDNVDSLKIEEMINWLKLNKKRFHLIIITNKEYSIKNILHLSIIKLNPSYEQYWRMDVKPKAALYEEIYEVFINCLKQNNIEHKFPLTYPCT